MSTDDNTAKETLGFAYKKYPKGTLESLNISMPKEQYDWVDSFRKSEGIAKSHVIQDAIECYRHARKLFGKNWKDQMKIQSEPLWAKKIIDLIENLQTLPVEQQAQAIEEVRQEMDTEGMIG